MNPTFNGPTQPDLWPVGKIPIKMSENSRETSESKARTHSYNHLIDLLIKLAMERGSFSHIDKYLCKICGGNPLLREILEGGRLNPALSLLIAVACS